MALIACRECGASVSTTAKACPSCGAPVRSARSASRRNVIVTALFALAGVWLVGGLISALSDAERTVVTVVRLNDAPGCSPARRDLQSPLSREYVEKAITGELETKVCFEIGAPARTSKHGDTSYWYYPGITEDPVTGRRDAGTQVVLKGGRVSAVSFR